MSKLNELAALLKAAKKQNIVEPALQEAKIELQMPPVEETKSVSSAPAVQESPKSSLEITLIQKEMQYMKKMFEDAMRRQMVPTYSGGGTSSTSDIDRPTKTVSSNYTPTTRDWYIGISDRNEIINITLPTNVKNGREYVVKDEVGIAELVPIRIIGTIDNDPEGLELRINNGSVTLLYHNGWRII